MKNANLVFFPVAVAVALGLTACRGDTAEAPAASRTVADRFDIGLGGTTVHMQVAVLPAELERGLMGRRDLGADEGMVFVFDSPQKLSFWMHDTPIPLDIGFFSPEGELAEIYPLYPFDERAAASRGSRLQLALEMNQGWFGRRGIKAGARLDMRALAAALRARGFDLGKLHLSE